MKDFVADVHECMALVGVERKAGRPRSPVVQTVREAILAGATNGAALALARERHPDADMNARHVANIRTAVRKEHPGVQTSHAASRGQSPTVAQVAQEAILRGATNAEVAVVVRAKFPDSVISEDGAAGYRTALRAVGLSVLTNRQAQASVPTVAQPVPRPAREPARPSRPVRGGPTVAAVAKAALRAWATDAEALAVVRAALPEARTTHDGIAFYRSAMRAEGEAVPTSSEVRRVRAGTAVLSAR